MKTLDNERLDNERLDKIKNWRFHLHQIPELGLQEYKTSSYIRNELKKLGYNYEEVIGTGTVVYLDYGKDHTIAFRSDIDGLPIKEETGKECASKHIGYMHACGHDGHATALLAFADALKDKKDLPNNILLIFQPAEESPGGAKLIIDEGILDKYHVEAVFGMHLMPQVPEGTIACKAGPLMAHNGELDVIVHGKSAHAGMRNLGIDSILIASEMIGKYYKKAQELANGDKYIVNIGEIHGGDVRNIVAAKTSFHGTVRTYSEELFDAFIQAFEEIDHEYEKKYGCSIEFSLPPMYPPLINDQELYPLFKKLVKGNYMELDDGLMLSEDFAYYTKYYKGIFFFTGTGCKEYNSGLHTDTFDFHEEVLLQAVDTYLSIAENIKIGGQ